MKNKFMAILLLSIFSVYSFAATDWERVTTKDFLRVGSKSSSANKGVQFESASSTRSIIRSNFISNVFEVSFDNGLNFDPISTGVEGVGEINNLDNPKFESGITNFWTCTSSRCTENDTTPLGDSKSLVFVPVAQNDEFKSDLKAIQPGLMGRFCEARVFYLGGDENLTAQILDGNGSSLGEKALQTHAAAGFEYVGFSCPTQSVIDGDSLKGDLQLRIFNEQVSISPTSTFDNMHLGEIINPVHTSLESGVRIESCQVNNDGTATIDTSSGLCEGWVFSTTRTAAGAVELVPIIGIFSKPPVCVCNTVANSQTICNPSLEPTTSLIRTLTESSTVGTDEDDEYSITCVGAR